MLFWTKLASLAWASRVVARRWYASVIWLSRLASSPPTSSRACLGTLVSFCPTSGQEMVATQPAEAAFVAFCPDLDSCAEA